MHLPKDRQIDGKNPLRIIEQEIEILERKIDSYEFADPREKRILLPKINYLWKRHMRKALKVREILDRPVAEINEADIAKIKSFLSEEKEIYSKIDWMNVAADKKGFVQVAQIILM
jgi:DNA replication initiation complex subunit (GINS family)